MNRQALFTIAFLLFTAFSLIACKASKEASAADSGDDMDNFETIGLEKEGSASDDNTLASGQDEEARQGSGGLIGEWVWTKTACCGRTMQETYPEAGEARTIAFYEDGKARFFTDGTKEKTSTVPYSLSKLGPKQPTVRIGELQPAIFAVSNDTLVLSWGYMDLQTEYYTRK